MSRKITSALAAFSLIIVNLLASCSSQNNDTTLTATKTIIPQTSDIQMLTAEPITIKAYDAQYMAAGAGFGAIKDMCLMCHGPGTGQGDIQAYGVLPGGSQFPLPPTWFGSSNTPGLWQVTPGSAADHTGRTNEQCLSCHQMAGYVIHDI